jgi:hypothetical protein
MELRLFFLFIFLCIGRRLSQLSDLDTVNETVHHQKAWNFDLWPFEMKNSPPAPTPFLIVLMVYRINPIIHFQWTSKLDPSLFTVIIVDDERENDMFAEIYENKYLIKMKDKFPMLNGYQYMNFLKGRITGWDKSMFLVSEIAPRYKFIWVFESDVWIPSTPAFLEVHKKAMKMHADVVLSDSMVEYNGNITAAKKWFWFSVNSTLTSYGLPYYRGMACAVGFNSKMIASIKKFIKTNQRLEFLEALFFTLAKKSHLKTYFAPELKFVFTLNVTKHWPCEKVAGLGYMNWYHPLKRPIHYIKECITSGKWDNSTMRQVLYG